MELQQYLFEGIFQTEKELVVPYQPVDFANITFEKNEETGKYQFDLLDHNLTGIINYEIAVKGKQSLYFDCFDELSNRLSEPINATFNVYVNGEPVSYTHLRLRAGRRRESNAPARDQCGGKDGVPGQWAPGNGIRIKRDRETPDPDSRPA